MKIPFAGYIEMVSDTLSRLLRLGSIKGKIFVVFAVAFLSITALTGLNMWNLSMLKTRMLLSEGYDDLLNNILELRRFEKNFLIYGDHRSLGESKEYLDRIDRLVDSLTADLPQLVGNEEFVLFRKTLREYRGMVERIGSDGRLAPDNLRHLGKMLTDTADRFRQIKRERIHRTLDRTSLLPFAFFAILLLVIVIVLLLVSQGLLKPLDVVMNTTRLVGQGDFSRIRYDGVRLEEIAGLIDAFNRMAQELETNQEDLIQTRKIAAIGTFTAGIAHELNNPINNIALTAESFCEEYGERMDASCSELIRDIITQADRAAEIVKNLLDFSRTESPVFSILAPAQILTSSVKLIRNQVKMVGLQIETSITRDLPMIRGNLGNLQQVLTNLLLNAIQVSPPGGKIGIHVDAGGPAGFVRFTVEDSGPGIPQEIRHKIFEPFFTTKEVSKGTGLGLAVSYSIIKRHGGRIEVGDNEGQGARFVVSLPAVVEKVTHDFHGWTAS